MSEILAVVESPKPATFGHFRKDVECQLAQWRFDRYLRKSELVICLEVHRRRDSPAMAARAIAKERVLLFHRLTSEVMETASLCRGPMSTQTDDHGLASLQGIRVDCSERLTRASAENASLLAAAVHRGVSHLSRIRQ